MDHMNKHARGHYVMLAVMTLLMFISMYVLMYAMVDKFGDVYTNYNQFYMAALMTAPMVLIELALMWAMYLNKKWNILIIAVSLVAFAGSFYAIRSQAAISDTQFLKSMIPHHSSAILMCREASIQDLQIKDLCSRIMKGQQGEIDEMNAKLKELENK